MNEDGWLEAAYEDANGGEVEDFADDNYGEWDYADYENGDI